MYLSDEYFMHQALSEARTAFHLGEVPVGAIVVYEQKIIAKAHNLTQQLNDVTAHAEILAITAASNFLGGKYLQDCALYVTLEPCVMCSGACYWSQIGKLIFAASDLKRGFSVINQKILHPKTEVVKGILSQPAQELLQDFFASKR